MGSKQGKRLERRLARIRDAQNVAVILSPASGSATSRPQPDVMDATGPRTGRCYECKYCTERTYLEEEEVRHLRWYAASFGCDAVIAAQFRGDRHIYLFHVDALDRTGTGKYAVRESDTDRAFDVLDHKEYGVT